MITKMEAIGSDETGGVVIGVTVAVSSAALAWGIGQDAIIGVLADPEEEESDDAEEV